MNKPRGDLAEIPFAFLGMGIFRVWTETVYSNGLIVFPAQSETGLGFTAFNIVAAIALFVLAAFAKRLVSLHGRRWPVPLTAGCLATSACLNFASIYFPNLAGAFGLPAVLLGGVGIALIILLWSELFGCLPPLRVGLYFSGGLVAGALILWLFKGLAIPWLWVCTCLVPIVSLACLKRSYQLLGEGERPHATWGERHFPWKPIAIVMLYSFAYGFCKSVFGGVLNIHSGIGCVAAAILVCAAIRRRTDNFSFSFTYKVACPLMIASLIPLASFLPFGDSISAFFALAGYTLVLIAVMVIMGNLCYEYGFNALWLFGIERAIRLLSVEFGIGVCDALGADAGIATIGGAITCVAAAASILLATRFFLSETSLTSAWGATLRKVDPNEPSPAERMRIEEKCRKIAQAFDLTPREEEVLVMVIAGKKPAQIAAEMFVAPSTVKTHVKHIYQKLDVHSRKELCALVGVKFDEPGL